MIFDISDQSHEQRDKAYNYCSINAESFNRHGMQHEKVSGNMHLAIGIF